MSFSLFNIFLAGLGLSFLVFIHELGHYIVARRAKMRVEVFSIGFGKPMYTWVRKGVKWQICYLLFGGYVKIAGMEKENGKDPHEIPDGFYGKRPWDRIKVAVMGPLVNIVFAFLIFSVIWVSGGREKPFAENTKIIGWVDETSELASMGVKPGDTITTYNGKPFQGYKDLVFNGVLKDSRTTISGMKVDYFTGKHEPYSFQLEPYSISSELKKGLKTIGVLAPASFLIFQDFDKNGFAKESGIAKGDRVLWANGELVFSYPHLRNIVNSSSVLMTVERAGNKLQLRIPRVSINELQLSMEQWHEFNDWKRALGSKEPIDSLYFIPYEVDELGRVKGAFSFIDADLVQVPDAKLLPGDKIISVQGEPINSGLKLFEKLKEKKVVIIVQKAKEGAPISWQDQDSTFVKSVNWASLQQLIASLGSGEAVEENDDFKVLAPIKLATFENREILGISLSDRNVVYNPSPFVLLGDTAKEMWLTLSSLFSGSLSPKWLSGPVGIVKVMHDSWTMGIKEALYWMALISLNLGFLNLLPIPILDGGHICFALWEMITRKRVAAKTMERLVLPFVVLLIMFFVYVTYQDISRLFVR